MLRHRDEVPRRCQPLLLTASAVQDFLKDNHLLSFMNITAVAHPVLRLASLDVVISSR